MADRTWTVRVNLDDLGAEMLVLDSDAERGAWMTGFQVGAAGGPCRETWSDAKRRGWEFGSRSFAEAEKFRAKKAAAGQASADARRSRSGSAQPSKPPQPRTPAEQCSSDVRGNIEYVSNQPTANSQQPTAKNEQPSPPTPQGGKRAPRMVPPSEQEWVAYCSETWPDWHPECAAESWAYYEAKGWRIGTAPCRDWKAVARTAHGNARNWGKLQPIAARGTNLAGSGGRTGQMSSEDQNRLKGLQIQKAAAERNLRIARNYPAEHDVDDCRRKLDAIRAQILRMGVDPDATTEAAR